MGSSTRGGWSAGAKRVASKYAEKDPQCQITEELHDSGRWLHVITSPAPGTQTLNLLVAYGVAGNQRLNEKFWNAALTYVAKLGNAPYLLGTDSHVNLDELQKMPSVMLPGILE